MMRLKQIFKNMKYRHKLTILLVVASLVPMTVLVLYSHIRMSTMIRKNEMEDMQSILEQTRESIDSQFAVFSSLLNYLTYSPDIEEIIKENITDNYAAYKSYTEVADPLLSIPKSYHDAINGIRLYADSIKVEHEYTLVPLSEISREWWSSTLEDDVRIQWRADADQKEIAAVRRICEGQELKAVLCITLDYDKIFQPLANIMDEENGILAADENGEILYQNTNLDNIGWKAGQNAGEALQEIRKTCVVTESKSGENDWSFYLFKTEGSVSSAVSHLLMEEIPLIAACVLIILGLGMFFSRLLLRKIEELTENMDRVNHGSMEVTVTSDSGDEVGLLVRSFRRMMDEINRLIGEVYVNKLALKEFELKSLQAQINPHFLYNSLSIINWMAIRSDQAEISRVTLALSTFYRTALSRGEDMVTMENCIRNIRAYLDIQLVMHDNDFTVEWKIDDSINNEKVPKLLLQPIVENALEHGLDEKETGEKLLRLSFLNAGDSVIIRVEDNGPGMEQEKAETLVTYQAEGYGLKNVNDRIRLLYGDEYTIRILSEPGKGTRVEMCLPKKIRKSQEPEGQEGVQDS